MKKDKLDTINKCSSKRKFLTNLLNKDIKEIKKIYLSLISVGIICLGVFLGINITKNSYALFSDSIKGEKTIELEIDNSINNTTVFNYTGSYQEYEILNDGYYYIELGGAQGEGDNSGKGAQVSGYIYLEKGETLYLYIGGTGGYNGEMTADSTYYNYSGGGATDVRLVNGNWDNISSLISRIMVAAGGGVESHGGAGGSGGTLYGKDGVYNITGTYTGAIANGKGGTQNSGGAAGAFNWTGTAPTAGSFGKGGRGNSDYGGNGGGGYYGGGGSGVSSSSKGGGAGGSSYISGYAGVNSVEENTTITHTNNTLHYSGKYFIGGKMLAGQNEGNGYAKITYVGEKPKKKTTKLDNVRYVRNCINDNSTQYHRNYWREIQAIKDGVNIAKGKSVTGTVPALSGYEYDHIVDGDISISHYAASSTGAPPGNTCVTIDLGNTYDLDEIFVSHGIGDIRVEYDNITSVSSDNKSFTTVINEASIESDNGQRANAYTDTYNGYIQDSLVLWYDGYANSGTTDRSYSINVWKDLSGNNNDGTLTGGTWGSKYLYFDGVNDYVESTSNLGISGNANLTMCAVASWQGDEWLLNYPSYMGISATGSYTGLSMTMYNGRPALDFWNYRYIASEALEVKKPYQICMTKTNGSINDTSKIYVNGKRVSGNGNSSSSPNITNSKAVVGRLDSTRWANANIYSVRYYNKALTEDEILHNYSYDKEKFNLE